MAALCAWERSPDRGHWLCFIRDQIRPVGMMVGLVAFSFVLSALASSEIDQLRNDNGEFYAGSRSGRLVGDVDGSVFSPPMDLFPLTILSVEFGFHKPVEVPAPWIGDTAQVRVQIYAMEDGVPGEILAESASQVFSTVDAWLSLPLEEPLTLIEPASFMAAVVWESGNSNLTALPLALDSNFGASQAEKDAVNLYHREDIFMPEPCREGFCVHSELFQTRHRDIGFNMIRVTVGLPVEATETTIPSPTQTTIATLTLSPSPTVTVTSVPTRERTATPTPPVTQRVHLPLIARNHTTVVRALSLGKISGQAEGFSLTSGSAVAGRCWLGGDEANLWVGREVDMERGRMRSVLRFNLSGIPAGAQVVRAGLQLFTVDAGTDRLPMPVYVHDVTAPWNECPTWNTLAHAVGEPWAMELVDPEVGLVEIDVTPLVRYWLEGKLDNFGLMLRGDENQVGRFRGFVSPNSSQEDLRPGLVIRYR